MRCLDGLVSFLCFWRLSLGIRHWELGVGGFMLSRAGETFLPAALAVSNKGDGWWTLESATCQFGGVQDERPARLQI